MDNDQFPHHILSTYTAPFAVMKTSGEPVVAARAVFVATRKLLTRVGESGRRALLSVADAIAEAYRRSNFDTMPDIANSLFATEIPPHLVVAATSASQRVQVDFERGHLTSATQAAERFIQYTLVESANAGMLNKIPLLEPKHDELHGMTSRLKEVRGLCSSAFAKLASYLYEKRTHERCKTPSELKPPGVSGSDDI